MSFILDALRRAESERARGQVPGLHDQPPLPAAAVPRSAWPAWAWALLAGLVLVLAAAAGWGLRPQAVVLPASLPPATPAPPVPAGVAAGPATAMPTPPAVVPSAAPARATTPLMPQVVSAPSPVVPAPAAAPVAASVAAPAAAPVAVPAPAAAPVVKLAELPADQRRDWPNLVLGGSVWSESAANRFVIINGLLLHEGEAVAPSLVVDRIGPKAVVLRWRERRVEVPL